MPEDMSIKTGDVFTIAGEPGRFIAFAPPPDMDKRKVKKLWRKFLQTAQTKNTKA